MIEVKVATLIVKDGKVLIGKEFEKWVVPGGPVKEFEKMQDAAIRTFRETTGITIKAEHILFVNEDIDAPAKHNLVVYAYGQYVKGEVEDKGEYSELRWVDVRELGALQDEMTSDTIDAFYKFSLVLRQQAARAVPQG